MKNPTVSVVVVSRGRPKSLRHCLLAISQLQYDSFEIVVVADQAGLDTVDGTGYSQRTKSVLFEVANISQARNIGIERAAGEIIAFIDDDAVPEPAWLHHLAAVFRDASVWAAGGYVRGKNGISYQCKAQKIDLSGVTIAIHVDDIFPTVIPASNGVSIKTEGTNCAFRRRFFVEFGGFDPAFPYYLDESDINIRVCNAGKATAIVPLAQVHHHRCASEFRNKNLVPLSLFQVGKSTAIFLRKHCAAQERAGAIETMIGSQKRQLTRHMSMGNCEPRDIGRLIQTLKLGIESGLSAQINKVKLLKATASKFLRFNQYSETRKHQIVAAFQIGAVGARKRAIAEVNKGDDVVSLFLFSCTALFHRVRFHADGYWEQTGGLFGRSIRTEPMFQWNSHKCRVAKEAKRVALARFPWDIESVEHDA